VTELWYSPIVLHIRAGYIAYHRPGSQKYFQARIPV